jgi:hypothetical protein
VEELQCLATWKEGSSRYLVGKIHHNHATSNEDRYRCFVYEKSTLPGVSGTGELNGEAMYHTLETRDDGIDYRVAQSGDATCNGLFSPMEGSRTMTLRKGEFLPLIHHLTKHMLLLLLLLFDILPLWKPTTVLISSKALTDV